MTTIDKEEHKEQINQFKNSRYYFTSINSELLGYISNRFGVNSVYQDEVEIDEQEQILKILRVSPSSLFFALHEDTTKFHEALSADDSKRMSQFLTRHFKQELAKNLFADIDSGLYNTIIGSDEIWMRNIKREVTLVTINEKYLDFITEATLGTRKLADDFDTSHFGQSISYVEPMDIANDGLAYLYLGQFQKAIERFDDAFESVQDLDDKAAILNNAISRFGL